jgi:hypothetical protein
MSDDVLNVPDVAADMTLIVCLSRCMHCGRQTPHEFCHECSPSVVGEKAAARRWRRVRRYSLFDTPPEQCDSAHCNAFRAEWSLPLPGQPTA